MNSNEQLIEKFYTAFQQLDWQAMAACYHQDIQFSDPVFPDLKGDEVISMWRMLCEKAEELELRITNITADESHGSARWEASYRFSQTGRLVHNIIFAEFQFIDGKIIRHSDHFGFWRWSAMALGPVGIVFGWSGFLKRKVQLAASKGHAAFVRRH